MSGEKGYVRGTETGTLEKNRLFNLIQAKTSFKTWPKCQKVNIFVKKNHIEHTPYNNKKRGNNVVIECFLNLSFVIISARGDIVFRECKPLSATSKQQS